MRLALVGFLCLLVGASATWGYEHFLGEGAARADTAQQLGLAQSDLAKARQESTDARKETEALTAQVQQLRASKDELAKRVATDPAANPGADSASASASPFAGAGMSNLIKAQVQQRSATRLQMMRSRLHLTPEQEAAVKTAMDSENAQAEAIAGKMFSGGKIDPHMIADAKSEKSVEQTLQDILTPEQKTAYDQMKADEKSSNAEMMASVQMNQMAPALQLTDAQKDQVSTALYQSQLDSQDPDWILKNSGPPGNPMAILTAQEKAKEDALAKILTPDQMATYRQQAQSQLDMQRAMMQRFTPATAVVPASAPTSPAPAAAAPAP